GALPTSARQDPAARPHVHPSPRRSLPASARPVSARPASRFGPPHVPPPPGPPRHAERLRDAVFLAGAFFADVFFADVFLAADLRVPDFPPPLPPPPAFEADDDEAVFFAGAFFAVDVDFFSPVFFGAERDDVRRGSCLTSASSSPRDSRAARTLFSSAAIRSSTLPSRSGWGISGGA